MSFQPEIKDDELYDVIVSLVREKKPRHILEIGSANGGGSTQAFIEGIVSLPQDHSCHLLCLEAHPERYSELEGNVGNLPFVKCHNASSVPVSEYLTDMQVADFMKGRPYGTFNIIRYGPGTVCGWKKEELATIVGCGVPQDGIDWAYQQIDDEFDMVLIDGSAFSGWAEYQRVGNARVLILDDTLDIKNFHATIDLLDRGSHKVIHENRKYRNGYAVFERIES